MNEKVSIRVGDRMADGSIFAGISPDTGKPMFTTPNDVPLTMTFNEAADYATSLDAHGHKDWRVPTRGEMRVLFESRKEIDNFNLSGSGHSAWYWSSETPNDVGAWCQRFSDGFQELGFRTDTIACRCVRSPADGEVLASAKEQKEEQAAQEQAAQERSAKEIERRLRRKSGDKKAPHLKS